MAANIAKIEGFVREAAKRGAQVVLPPELFQSIYFPTRQDPKWFEMAKPASEHPSRARAAEARQGAENRHSHLLLREGRPALLQQRGDGRCRRRDPRGLPQEPHPRRPRLSGEILLPPRRHRLPGVEDEGRHHRRRHLLGSMVPGGGARHGAEGRRDSALSDGHRLRALRSLPRHACALAARDAGPRRVERRAGRRREPHRRGAERRRGSELSTATPSSPTMPASWSASFGDDGGGRADARASISPRSSVTAPNGASSATAAPTSTPRASFNMGLPP